jgi:CRISPR-associated protein Cmr6
VSTLRSTRGSIEGEARAAPVSHPGLYLERYLVYQVTDGENEERTNLLDKVAAYRPPDLYLAAYQRWVETLHGLPYVCSARVRVLDRLIVGLGSEGVLETGITVHRTYGVPVIPGSALKGLLRRYVGRQVRDLPVSQWADDPYMRVLFGAQNAAGHLEFFDAWYVPDSRNPFAVDVITVHHPMYYTGITRREPTDFDDPNPVSFISARGDYLVAVRGPDNRWAKSGLDGLLHALSDYGVGGKTSSGYGRLERVGDVRHAGSGPGTAAEHPLVQTIRSLRPADVKSQIDEIAKRWASLTEPGARSQVGKVLGERLRSAGLLADKKWREKRPWVAELENLKSPE